MPVDEIESAAKIVEIIAEGVYRAELANGHRCVARSPRGAEAKWKPGDSVRLVFSPADLSRARIKR